MNRIVIFVAVCLMFTIAALLVRNHVSQFGVLGLWSAPSGASVQFSSAGTVTIHPPSVTAGGSPSATPVTSGNYRILDRSHLQITVSGFHPVVTEYSISGDALKLTTPGDGVTRLPGPV